MKKYTVALALVSGFVVAPALSSLSTVQAQDGRYRQDRRDDRQDQRRNDGSGRNDGQVDRNGNIDRNQNGIDDRYENNGQVNRNGNIDRNRNGVDDRYENNGRDGNRRYDNNGRYDNDRFGNGNFGGFGNRLDPQRGYRDGLNKGRDDARTGDRFNPNNSSLYRHGNAAYREAFFDGYKRGYRLYDNRGQYGRR